MSRAQRQAPRRVSDEQGAVLVEFSIVFVLFAVLLSGLIQYGVIFATEQSITHAASEAARVVVDIPDSNGDGSTADEAEARITNEIEQQLDWLDGAIVAGDGRGVDVTVACDGCTGGAPSCTGCVDVTVTFNWEDDAIVPQVIPVAVPSTLHAAASVQYQ